MREQSSAKSNPESINYVGKTGPTVALIYYNCRIVICSLLIGCATKMKGHFCEKILLFVRDCGKGNDPTSGAILGNRPNKVGKY